MPEPVQAILELLVGFGMASFLLLNPARRRWLLWQLRCRRGRRCARVEFGGFDPETQELPPAGALITFEYTCGGCETRYHLSVIAGEDGDYTVADRTIVAPGVRA